MRLARLAERQHGIVTARQLRALDFSASAVRYRVRIGRLQPVHRGVYAVGHRDPSQRARFLAAVAAVGRGAVLSRVSAATLWGLHRVAGHEAVDVSVTRSVRPRSGIRLHVVRALPPDDVTRQHGIPVTTAARTLLDLAGVLEARALARAVHEAEVQGIARHAELRTRVQDAGRAPGASVLSAILDDGPVRTRSELEEATLALLRRHDFPAPRTNTRVPGLPAWVEVDFSFPGTDVIIEVDGDRFHGTRWRRRMDARKQALLEAAGYRVIRLTWDQITREEAQTVRRLRLALDRARRAPAR